MRTQYHQQLAVLMTQLGEMCGRAGQAMRDATRALLTDDPDGAQRVIDEHPRTVEMRERIEKEAFDLLALQQPVAGELRVVFSAIGILADTERMSALAVHVAEIARRESVGHSLPAEIRHHIAEMADLAINLSDRAQRVLVSRDPRQAARLRDRDDAMDELYRQLFGMLLEQDAQRGPRVGVEAALLGRFYERFADHAVEVGRRVVFMATGALPREPDASDRVGSPARAGG